MTQRRERLQINTIMRFIFLFIFLIFFSLFYLNVNDFIFAVYSLTHISAILSISVVVTGVWVVIFTAGCGLLFALKDVKKGLEWIIILLPLSALPFILLGVPLGALNTVFICRSLLNLFIYLFFLKWFLDFSLVEKSGIRVPLFIVNLLLMMAYILDWIFVEDQIKFQVFQSCIILASCILFFYLIVNILRDEKSVVRIFEVMVIACIIQVLMSSLSFFYYLIIKGRTIFRVEGMLRDFELFAEYLAIHIPLFIFLLRNPGAIIPKKILKIFLMATIFVLLATSTRGAIVSLGCGLIYYIVKIRSKVRLSKITLQILGWGITVGIILIVLYRILPSSAQIIERFAGTKITTLDTRQYVWTKFWGYFIEKPITGYGVVYNLGSYLFFPHSTYFYYLLTLGIPGLLSYFILIGTILFKGFKNVRMARTEGQFFEISIVTNTMFIMFIIDSIKIEYLRYSNYQLFIWLLFALVIAISELLIEKRNRVICVS